MEGKLNFIFRLRIVEIKNRFSREKVLEFIRSCLETETVQIGILVRRGFEV